MARPRAFDEDSVLDAAIERFWRRGYASTSMSDLLKAMGLAPASLYNTFGGKHALFTRALDRYLDGHMRARVARLEANLPPRQAMEAFFHEVVAGALCDPNRRGCLLVNSALEIAPHDGQLGPVIARRLAELEQFFHRCATGAQRTGTMSREPDPSDLARLFLAAIIGILVLARARPDRDLLEGIARQALAALGSGDPAMPIRLSIDHLTQPLIQEHAS